VKENIFLIGFMGCGKSTIGKQLAKLMQYDFVDLDIEIELQNQITITELFLKGETYFRIAEQACLHQVAQKQKQVVAVGGGAPCFYNNLELMNDSGLTIYLSMPPAALHSRLKNAKDKRPLLTNVPDNKLQSFITSLLQQREPFYLKANLHVASLNCKAGYLFQLIEMAGWFHKNKYN